VNDPATGTTRLISRAGSVIGSVRADPATGNVNVLGAAGDILGSLGINPVNNAVTYVPVSSPPVPGAATQALDPRNVPSRSDDTRADLSAPLHDAEGNVVGEVDINLSTGRVTLVGVVPASPASGTEATDVPVEVFDINGDSVGFAVGDPTTGAVELVGLGGAVVGTVRADPLTGTLVVVPNDVPSGQLGVNPATGKVVLVPSGGLVSRS